MDPNMFRLITMAALLIGMALGILNKKNGGVYGFLITTVILILGLNAYSQPGWVLSVGGLEWSKELFYLFILFWYIVDIVLITRSEFWKENKKGILIFSISWLIPGLGHILLKRYIRGAVFFGGILTLLILGIIMEGKFFDARSLHPLLLLGFLGDLGNGIFYFIIQSVGMGGGNIKSMTYHYGTTYMAAAGLINYLIALHAFDLVKGRKE